MPELPDITLYIESLELRLLGRRLKRARILSPFALRSAAPGLDAFEGRSVVSLRRIGKRIAIGFEGELWIVIHLMIAGRLHWRSEWPPDTSRRTAALFEFETGVLELTEAGTRKRASIHLVAGADALARHDPGGIEIDRATETDFVRAITAQNHTLKRALTDPAILSGIGNAYSDEILHRAHLSPIALTQRLDEDELARLFEATRATLAEWTARLRRATGGSFPEKVTAFRNGMAVHGRYGEACPDCGTRVQRIRYASNETNYCPRCQTGGKLLADRALSRLLKRDWPRTIDELEGRTRRA
jgi:formamidopyrimidine-DNA glycosylase